MSFLDKLKGLLQSSKLNVDSRFELLKEAVSGTMSQFYKARDRKSGDLVGLKIVDQEKLELFEARFPGMTRPPEGEIAVKMEHEHIVKTHEHGVTTKGLQYLVMEFLNGPGLHMLIHEESHLLDGCRWRLIKQMAEALEYVHLSGYIHRDVCPRNFICTHDLESLKLIDFGLALPATEDFMRPGNRTGTPIYMAPEIIRRRRTDHRVDIFAFGVSAYQLCTFDLPWPHGEKAALAAMSHDTAPPTDILDRRPDLNKTLAAAIMKCLERDPAKRPEDMREFIRMLRGVDSDVEPESPDVPDQE